MAPVQGTIERVIDGDTLVCVIRVRTRIDAPESGTAEGDAATRRMNARFPRGSKVMLHMVAADPYGRMVAVLTEP